MPLKIATFAADPRQLDGGQLLAAHLASTTARDAFHARAIVRDHWLADRWVEVYAADGALLATVDPRQELPPCQF